MFEKVFSPIKIGPLDLKNRIVMAPLTRQVADADGTPTVEMAAYYARRARGGVGLIISEGTYEADDSGCKAYLSQPGIANEKHVAAWKMTTDAVHALGTPIICQLMHGAVLLIRAVSLRAKARYPPRTRKARVGCCIPIPMTKSMIAGSMETGRR
ncbi:MAG: hypothetical protein OXD29_15695 [Roseovarius sp.]|nr:hypothetical protein [Roseovarius sp.]